MTPKAIDRLTAASSVAPFSVPAAVRHLRKGMIVRRVLLLIGAFIQMLLVAPALAAPVCPTQTLSYYITTFGVGGCEVDGVTFSKFVEVAPVHDLNEQIDSSLVTLTPISDAGGVGFALSSASAISAGAGELLELWFGYMATLAGALTGNTLSLGTPTVTGDGAITIVEDKCLDGNFATPSENCSGTPVTLIVFAIDGDSELQATTEPFAGPVSFFDVFVDLVIDGGIGGSAALGPQLSEVRVAADGTATVPEPPTIAALALALLAMASLRRRLRARAQTRA